jgi:hypothetical protein
MNCFQDAIEKKNVFFFLLQSSNAEAKKVAELPQEDKEANTTPEPQTPEPPVKRGRGRPRKSEVW